MKIAGSHYFVTTDRQVWEESFHHSLLEINQWIASLCYQSLLIRWVTNLGTSKELTSFHLLPRTFIILLTDLLPSVSVFIH